LEHVSIATIMSRVNDDLKVIVQFLADIPAQLGGDDAFGIGIEAGDAEIDVMLAVENANLRFFSRSLSLKGLSLAKVGNRRGLLPDGIIQCAVNAACLRGSETLRGSDLSFLGFCAWLRLRVKK
jgi:hypothetical protein